MEKKVKNIVIFIIILIVRISLKTDSYASKINEEEINIEAPNVILAQTDTGKVLYEKGADEKIFPASITKVLTAILVVENCELDEIVTVSEKAVTSVPSGYVNANLQVGEELMVKDLLYVMLIPSANDAANVLAEHVGGTIESFSTMMNTKAKELGCTGSNLTNPSGLHQEEHYTTTRDLLLISREAIKNNTIKKILGTTTYSLMNTNKYTKTQRTFITTNYMKRQSLSKYYCDYCIGGKTGYTEYAKNCVVEFTEKNGINLIAIIMGADSNVKGEKFLQAKSLFEYTYNNYENKTIANSYGIYDTIKILNGTKDTRNLDILYKEDVKILERKNIQVQELDKKVEFIKIKAPINKKEVVGTVTYIYDDIEYKVDLIAGDNVEESKAITKILMILGIVLIIYIIYNFKKINRKTKRKYGNHGKIKK